MTGQTRKPFAKRLLPLLFSLLVFALLLAVPEILVRIFCDVNVQSTDSGLLEPGAFGETFGLKKNHAGECFGQTVRTDADGFRDLSGSAQADKYWLLLGDSVAFGVGVKAEDTFAGKLQKALPEIKIVNAAVISYSLPSYRDVLREFAKKEKMPERIILFYCLNDIYGYPAILPPPEGAVASSFEFLKSHSRLYMFTKHLFADRQKAFFENDRALYVETGEQYRAALPILDEIVSLSRSIAPLTVVLLPYEYQVRLPSEENFTPQNLLAAHLKKLGVNVIDARDYFRETGKDSKSYYLTADAMHFSPAGHEAVFRLLGKLSASPSQTPLDGR
jgi:lysophospholipase L1-like esterase